MGASRALEPASFEGAKLEQMRGWVESGAGAQALYDKAAAWGAEQKFMTDLAERVKGRLAQANAVIESKSGDAMQNAVAPVVLWTEVTAENAQVQQERMRDQGDAFNKVKSAIPKKEEETPVPDDNMFEEGWDNLVNGKTDAEAAKEQNEALRQEAVTAFNGYQSSSQNTVAASAVFTAPPSGGMETSVQSGPQSSVGGTATSFSGSGQPASTQSSWAGGGGGASADPSQYSGRAPAVTSPSAHAPVADPASRNPDWQRQQELQRQQQRAQQGGMPGPGGGSGRGPGAGAGRGAAGRGGMGAGGRGVGSGAGAGGRGARGPGGASGAGGGRAGAGAGGARGGGGAMGGAGAAGRGQQGGEDEEHETPDYLKGDQGVFDDELPKVAPPVFGDWEQK